MLSELDFCMEQTETKKLSNLETALTLGSVSIVVWVSMFFVYKFISPESIIFVIMYSPIGVPIVSSIFNWVASSDYKKGGITLLLTVLALILIFFIMLSRFFIMLIYLWLIYDCIIIVKNTDDFIKKIIASISFSIIPLIVIWYMGYFKELHFG